jgi:hypothetical protein
MVFEAFLLASAGKIVLAIIIIPVFIVVLILSFYFQSGRVNRKKK